MCLGEVKYWGDLKNYFLWVMKQLIITKIGFHYLYDYTIGSC